MLLKKMTPAAQAGSRGSHNNAPTMTSEPRGSFTIADRKLSCSVRKRSSRWVRGPWPRSGPPLTTTRVGSPPVWESITRTLRILRSIILSHFLTKEEVASPLVDIQVEVVTEALERHLISAGEIEAEPARGKISTGLRPSVEDEPGISLLDLVDNFR